MASVLGSTTFVVDDEAFNDTNSFYERDDDDIGYVSASTNAPILFTAENEAPVPKSTRGWSLTSLHRLVDVSQYTSLFAVDANDVCGRMLRACVPYRGLLTEPPPVPEVSVAEAEQSTSDVEEDVPRDSEADAELDNGRENVHDAAADRSVASRAVRNTVPDKKPWNSSPDLYGPIWISATLVLCVAVSANIVEVIRSFATQGHAVRLPVSALTAIDFRNLVTAASGVFAYVVGGGLCVALLKRYVKDSQSASVMYSICVYGYSMTPFIPTVFLCAVIPGHWSWAVASCSILASSWTVVSNLWPSTTLNPFSSTSTEIRTADASNTGEIRLATGLTSYGSPDTGQRGFRPPWWWLRFTVAAVHVAAGVLLKLRYV